MFVVEDNGKRQFSTSTLERAKLRAQSYLKDGNAVSIRADATTSERFTYVYDALAVAWVKLRIH